MQGEDVRAEDIIADNMATIAQGLTNKGNLAHPSTIYKLCKDAGVPLREFSRTPRIPKLSYITAKRMETIRFPRNQPQQQHEKDDEDEPMPQADGANHEEADQQPPQQDQQPQQHEISSGLHGRGQAIKGKQEQIYNHNQRFYFQMWQEQEKLTKEIQEIRRSQLAQTMANNKSDVENPCGVSDSPPASAPDRIK
ncbi:hypothetical protein PIB30_092783 [Stylosanthes scabra]|uniref:Uncharacterized protein n=1 Tax=Stylosanthes scabra TaxID=79078 RepID=A0ABU6UUF2_9FABA|nr:hypothetical protein [Stylosanthes scabra]